MTQRIKESERQRMLIEYVKNGTVPDGFYVKTMKDGVRVQFRRLKSNPSEMQIRAKIENYKSKIAELEGMLKKD